MSTRKKTQDTIDSEPLSNFQDTSKTGRKDVVDTVVLTGTSEEIHNKLKNALNKAKGHNEADALIDKEIDITGATLSGDFCNYSYEILKGKCKGDSVNRSGSNIYHPDLKKAFWKLFVHLAVICEEIEVSKIPSIEDLENIDFDSLLSENDKLVFKKGTSEDRVTHFSVSSFRLKGTGENAGVVLVGTKTLSTGELVKLTTPEVRWEGSYAFINELRVVIDELKLEVEEYMNGKAAPKLVQQEMFNDELAEENV